MMTKNFPNLVKEKDIQVQEVQRVSYQMDPKRCTPRHITVKMAHLKNKKVILKAARENQIVTSKEAPIRLSLDFLAETLQARRE